MSGGNINISGLSPVDDPEYRYKMPRLMGKVEGRGNGIKTAIVNMRELALALHREPGEVTKFFGCELGAQTKWTDDTDKSIVNGAHTDQVLQQLLHKYIELFVLCPNCHLPESKYKIKGDMIYHNCAACGARESVDMTHKLANFIFTNHKKEKKEKDGEKSKKKDKGDKSKSDKGEKGDDAAAAAAAKKERKEKKKREKKEQAENAEKGDSAGSPDEEELDDEITIQTDDEATFNNCVASIRRHIDEKVSSDSLLAELKTAQAFSGFPVEARIHLYVATMFDTAKPAEVASVLAESSPILRLLCSGRPDQRHIIGAFELLCHRREVMKKLFPFFLKTLYDGDILEEETILEWAKEGCTMMYSHPTVKASLVDDLVNVSQPFIDWLQEAEEESGEESGEEED